MDCKEDVVQRYILILNLKLIVLKMSLVSHEIIMDKKLINYSQDADEPMQNMETRLQSCNQYVHK